MGQGWLIVLLAGAAVLPVLVAVAMIGWAYMRGQIHDLRTPLAFSKGMALGVAAGLTVSAVVVGLVLGAARLAGR